MKVTGFTFLQPFLVIIGLIVLCILVLVNSKSKENNKNNFSLLVPSIIPFRDNFFSAKDRWIKFSKKAFIYLGLTLLIIASGRPVKYEKLSNDEKLKNIFLCLDVSPSMDERDYVINSRRTSRLAALLKVSQEFITNLKSVRIGLVVFGNSAFLQSPLTPDYNSVLDSVLRLRTGIAGAGTAIGDGLALSIKRIRKIPAESSSIILFTDGRHNSGMIDPFQSGKIAKDLNVKIHTVGIGGLNSNPSSVDEPTLKKIASMTNGVYAYAKSTESLREIYKQLEKLEKTNQESVAAKNIIDYYGIFAVIGIFIALIAILL